MENIQKEIGISIVGGGASCVCFFQALVDEVKGNLDIFRAQKITIALTVFEKSPDYEPLGPGYAFSPHQSETNLMNSQLDYVSLRGYDDEEHFLKWLIKEKEKWGPMFPQILNDLEDGKLTLSGSFLPRKLAGEYMAHTFQMLQYESRDLPIKTAVIRDTVTSLSVNSLDKVDTLTHFWESITSDYVLLATGNLEN